MRVGARSDAHPGSRTTADFGDGAHLSLRVSVHVSARTTAEVTTYADEGRATIDLGGYRGSTGVTLFVRTPELRELRDLLSDTLTTLSTDADTGAAWGVHDGRYHRPEAALTAPPQLYGCELIGPTP